jgi:hypothetical protein
MGLTKPKKEKKNAICPNAKGLHQQEGIDFLRRIVLL